MEPNLSPVEGQPFAQEALRFSSEVTTSYDKI